MVVIGRSVVGGRRDGCASSCCYLCELLKRMGEEDDDVLMNNQITS